jgi:hypothetical protein
MDQPVPFTNASNRLREARLKVGLTPEAVGEKVGLGVNWYRDLEGHDGDLSCNISLAHFSVLCGVVGITPKDLLLGPDTPPIRTEVSFTELVDALKLKADGLSVAALSEKVGWEVKNLLMDPQDLWNFTIDGACDLCNFAGIPWTSLLRHLSQALETQA